jgi:hypothetical protein
MVMTAPGGHLIMVTPTNNEAGHGFYQFSPELLFRVLAPPYGFEIEQMLLCEVRRLRSRWFEVLDPAKVGARAQFRSHAVTLLYLRARRIGAVSPFVPPPQQSDYVARWGDREQTTVGPLGSLYKIGRQHAPEAIKNAYRWLRQRLQPNHLHLRHDYRRLRTHFKPTSGPRL